MPNLMDSIRRAFGLEPTMSPSEEQAEIAKRLERIESRIEARQRAIDAQNDILRADRRDLRSRS